MFTLNDLREIAVQIELNGESTYREAGRRSKNPRVAELLKLMADEEKRHAEWFQKMGTGEISIAGIDGHAEKMGRTLLREVMAEQTFSLESNSLIKESKSGVINKSLVFEKDTILFYEMLMGFLDDPNTIQHLKGIIEEEHRHVQRLEEMIATRSF
jgi:rubrerythrin